jgi:DNA-binding winged helix-turn-helix (wHTH) protein/Flp pilus assembly protein TadD
MRRLLLKGSQAIPVSERLAIILSQLLQANGRVVNKEVLAMSVWPDGAVSDANIVQHVYMLRRLFGEKAKDHSFILAVPGRGYRFAPPVEIVQTGFDEPFTTDAASLGVIASSEDFDAFKNYCRGSFFLAQRTPATLNRALEFFSESLNLNPDYVPALIGFARCYGLLGSYGYVSQALTCPLAAEAIAQALVLDPTSAVAHAVRAGLLCFCEWDWNGAREEIRAAIRLNPGSPLVRNNAAWLDVCIGQYDDALAQGRFALALEPASLLYQLLVARVLVHAADYPHAIAIMSNIIEMEPTLYVARRYRAQALLLAGSPENALSDLQLLSQEKGEDSSFRLPMLARAYADLGDPRRAADVFHALQRLSKAEHVLSWNLAIAAAAIHQFDDALDYLEASYKNREPLLPFLRSLPWFKQIANDPRFISLLEKIGP